MKKPFFRPFRSSIHILYHLRLVTEALFAVKRSVRTKLVAVCFRIYHAVHKLLSDVHILFANQIVKRAGLTPCTGIVVRVNGPAPASRSGADLNSSPAHAVLPAH